MGLHKGAPTIWTQFSQPWMDFIKMLLDRLIESHVEADNEECCWQYISIAYLNFKSRKNSCDE